jgi:hypothetical protein
MLVKTLHGNLMVATFTRDGTRQILEAIISSQHVRFPNLLYYVQIASNGWAPGPLSLCLNIDGTNSVRLHRRSSSKGRAAEATKVGLIHEASKSVTGVSNL